MIFASCFGVYTVSLRFKCFFRPLKFVLAWVKQLLQRQLLGPARIPSVHGATSWHVSLIFHPFTKQNGPAAGDCDDSHLPCHASWTDANRSSIGTVFTKLLHFLGAVPYSHLSFRGIKGDWKQIIWLFTFHQTRSYIEKLNYLRAGCSYLNHSMVTNICLGQI